MPLRERLLLDLARVLPPDADLLLALVDLLRVLAAFVVLALLPLDDLERLLLDFDPPEDLEVDDFRLLDFVFSSAMIF